MTTSVFERTPMTTAHDIAGFIAEHQNSNGWDIADKLVELFPESEYPRTNKQSGLIGKLGAVEDELRKEHGIVRTVSMMQKDRRAALNFPASTRVLAVSYSVHIVCRDERELGKWLKSAAKENTALTVKMVGRYRADEKRAKEGPKSAKPFEVQMAARIRSAAIAVYLGSYNITSDDWWNAKGFTDDKRANLVEVLRSIADEVSDAS